MIITRIRGGLGNQLFQYAAGHAASLRYGQPHYLDLRFYDNDKHRDYGLGRFNISAKVASSDMLPPAKETDLLKYAAWKYFGMDPRYVKDMDFVRGKRITPKFAESKFTGRAYMAGLWCSEYFFCDFVSEVRDELTLNHDLSCRGNEFLNQINNRVSVSLHVRRGDFVQNRSVYSRFGVCSVDYYKKAIDYVVSQLNKDFCIFIFSDDLKWAKDNLKFSREMVFVEAASNRVPHEDLVLMAACDHHITSNSTFSWWGAWLDTNSKKLVVCPEKWYVARRKGMHGMAPDSWVSFPAFS